jgi:dTDP-4-amino-4,6-dideoxygalactose transaminase
VKRVPFVDLKAQSVDLSKDLVSAFERVLRSGNFVLGAEVDDFERKAAARIGVRHAVGVSSGTDALLVALLALGIGPGDEIVTTPLSFISTAEAIVRAGATPRFVDVEPSTLSVNAALVEEAITPDTRAIIPVHLFGRPARLPVLSNLAAQRGLFLLEDAAQAYGSSIGQRPVGAWGHAGCFSFFPTKLLGAVGDAGMVVTDDDALAGRLRQLRQHGVDREGRYRALGGNFRLDALQAALLAVKMSHVDRWISLRRAHVAAYDRAFRGLPGLDLLDGVPEASWNCAIYTIRVQNGRRDALRRYLAEQGVETRVYYDSPLHVQPIFGRIGLRQGALPEAELASRQVLSLPLFPELEPDQRDWVIESVLRFLGA